MPKFFLLVAVFATRAFGSHTAVAMPWAQVGDAQLRSDIAVLAAAGVVDNITMQWPIAWGGILFRLEQPGALTGQPAYIVRAAKRVLARGHMETEQHKLRLSLTVDGSNAPAVVRGFDALGRQKAQGQLALEYIWDTTAVHLAVGAQSTNRYDHQTLVFDGSYVAQRVGNAAMYAGYMTHWWGPGWNTALSLSNNARPFPQIGFSRIDTTPFQSSWLSWIGPWQAEFFVGVLDGKRIAENTLFNGARVSINPLPGLELALARTEQLCGTGHPCKPLAEFANVQNNDQHPSKSKDETNFDFKYTGMLSSSPYEIYLQVMDRDTGPFTHSFSSHLFGASLWVPVYKTDMRVTAEYADTISTLNFFSFGKDVYGITYTDYKYVDGWQYRGRTLGASLGGDSRLATLQASWIGAHSITYTFSYDRAAIGVPQAPTSNIVSSSPVTINIGEARIRVPTERVDWDFAVRLQDDQPRPDRGFQASFEVSAAVKL
jgi:Capsule assembly protein Wzi